MLMRQVMYQVTYQHYLVEAHIYHMHVVFEQQEQKEVLVVTD